MASATSAAPEVIISVTSSALAILVPASVAPEIVILIASAALKMIPSPKELVETQEEEDSGGGTG